MRVLLFRTLCDTGGVSTWMLEHARELERRGIQCDFWFCRKSRRLAEFEATGRVTVGPIWDLVARLESRYYDVVHVPSGDPLADLVARATPPGSGVVATSHGALARMFDSKNCTAVTAVSAGIARLNQPWTDVRIDVIQNGIDAARFHTGDSGAAATGAPIVAFVGRVTAEQKQFPRFASIAARLVAYGYRVWIADAHGASSEWLAERLDEPLPVEVWRPFGSDEMPDLYRAIGESGGAVLMPSVYEGFPFVAVEAAACGAPTAAHDVIGMREAIIPDVTGMVFSPTADVESAAAQIDAWLSARGDLAAWRARCASTAAEVFNLRRMVDLYLEVYARRAPITETADASVGETLRPTDPHAPDESFLRAWWRAQAPIRSRFLAEAALGLVHHDYPDLALWAVGRAILADPRAVVSAKKLRTICEVGARVTLRPDRMRRRLSSRRTILAQHAVA